VFADRVDAGRQLAAALVARRDLHLDAVRPGDAVVLGLPRGGVVVAAEVAKALELPLDVIVIRKLGAPGHRELAMGAVAEDGARILDPAIVARTKASAEQVAAIEAQERAALAERVRRLRRGRGRPDLVGRTALVVDDGIATGASARIACAVARRLGARRVVLAVPVAPAATTRNFPEADAVVTVQRPTPFYAVGAHYRDFRPVSDDEVAALLFRTPGET
jgi:putative phosphoribosyl transferase